jgi:hypothetical protein
MKRTRIVKVGTIGVDTAMCYIGDPCYIAHTPLGHTDDDPHDEHWQAFLKQVNGPGENDFLETAAVVMGKYPGGHTFPAGVVVKTGWGDGEYPVTIVIQDGRVASLHITFIDD